MTPANCKLDDCDLPTKTRGYCRKHYWRVWKNGDPYINNRTTHGKTYTREYRIWHAMNSRCHSQSGLRDKNYGGRGIIVCFRWRNSFEDFLEDMGTVPSGNHSIDREDVNGNYEPSNCRWATKKQQDNNRRNTRWVVMNGETKSLSEWADILGLNKGTVKTRVRRGWSYERALEVKNAS